MAIASIDLNNPGPTAALLASALPILIGCVSTYFKLFVDPPKEFRDRIRLKRKELLERVAMSLTVLLNHSRRIDSDEVLRGDGQEQPDLVGDYNLQLYRTILIFERVEFIRLIVRVSYYIIYVAIALGIICGIVAAVSDISRKYVLWVALLLLVLELLVISTVHLSAERLETYEDLT